MLHADIVELAGGTLVHWNIGTLVHWNIAVLLFRHAAATLIEALNYIMKFASLKDRQ